jgi:AcrR family transcriptional regulator
VHPVPRAAALSPEARRRAIIDATIPLLRNYGRAVTTAQIAMAAGVAEGTLFRVFPDKDSLIAAAVQVAFEPSPADRELGAIERGLPLRDKLIIAVEILQRRVQAVWQLITMLNLQPPDRGKPDGARFGTAQRVFIDLLEPHADELRCDLAHAARLIRILTFAGTHPRIADGPELTAAEIVAVALDGIRKRADLDASELEP